MDYIKKTICIEGARTRTQGLMPYYAFGVSYEQHDSVSGTVDSLGLEIADGENGNWGQFVANPYFLASCGKTYDAMLDKYYELLNMVRNGVKLRKVVSNEGDIIFTEDTGSFFYNGECFSGGTEPDYLYGYAAYNAENFTSVQIESLREETRNIYRADTEIDDEFVVLINDYDKFQGLASYLDGTSYSGVGIQADVIENAEEHMKWAEYCKVVDECIGVINIPASIYNEHIKVPKRMPCADVEPYIEWLENYQKLSADCCNMRLYEDMGGEDMLVEMRKHQGECEEKLEQLNNLPYSVPYIEMPLLLMQDYTDVGVLTNLDGVEYEAGSTTRPHRVSGHTEQVLKEIPVSGYCGTTIDVIEMGGSAHTFGDIEVESFLQTLRNRKKYTDDNDNVLPGDFKKFDNPAGKMYVCRKANNGKWLMGAVDADPNECKNADGVMSGEKIVGDEGPKYPPSDNYETATGKFYRTITTCEAGIRIAETEEEETNTQDPANTHYYFFVKYDNSSAKPMTIPYKVGNATNVYLVDAEDNLYRGDFIIGISAESNTFKVEYVIGGYFTGDENGNYEEWTKQELGDIYREEYDLDTKHVDYVALDGVGDVPVYSEYIDFIGASKEFYSPVYDLYRTGNTATIIRLTSGDIWSEEFNKKLAWKTYDAYLVKEEYLTNFSLPPKVDVNVTIDRGGVSAFEKHYKLSECNTMQDISQYGNNFFNIQ